MQDRASFGKMIGGKTESGLQYAVRRSGSAVGYCALSIRCGTRDEMTGAGNGGSFHSGIAHFTEHTIFKGTDRKSASVINGYLDRLGGELNAYTTKEEIVLHATVLKEDLRKAASLLFELATSPTFPEDEVTTEKGVVIDEINSYRDAPSEEIYDKFEEMLFAGHPLSNPILGTSASVKKITSMELLTFIREKFVPEDMAFTVVADIDERKMAKMAEDLSGKFFKHFNRPACSTEACPGKRLSMVKVPENIFDKTISRRNHQVNCVIGGLAPSLYDERERIATVLLCNILGGPANNSILNSVLREKNGWVYGIECSYTQYADTGIVTICLGCDKENLDKCIRAIDKELGKIQAIPLSTGRLKAAKKQLLGQLAISSDNGETQCLSMGKSLLAYGSIASDSSNREKIEGITAEEIQDMAKALFARERLSRLTFI
ncbi:MAG: insulinase family protein [Clostridium sp.]|nr:insulinase family protein [Clostridium sp.]